LRALLLGLGRLWLRSLRVRWETETDPPQRAIIVLWHEHLPICMRAFSHRGIDVLISRSADGDWAAEACERFGYRVHRGSSTRGSMGGMRALARSLGRGNGSAGMALDGPRGPRRVAKTGSLWLSAQTLAPIIPVWVEAPKSFRLKSWDRCVVPLPFSEVTLRVGAPLHPRNLEDLEAAMRRLETNARETVAAALAQA
jgi:lysophospholipid acyltransferase (LPLAT)-like uncharacterized protein